MGDQVWPMGLVFQEGERLFRAHSHFDIVKGGTQGFPRHEVSDKQEVLFEDVSPSTCFWLKVAECARRFVGQCTRMRYLVQLGVCLRQTCNRGG